MKKKFSTILVSVLLICAMVLPASAAQQIDRTSKVFYAECGPIEVETTLTVYESGARSNSRRANVTNTYKNNGKVIAEVTLSATFGYDGKTAWVISASGSHTTYDGWSYGSEKIGKSNSTASLSAALDHSYYASISVDISLTCSPTGQIS